MPVDEPNPNEPFLLVLRCSRCGDTFPAHAGDGVICPTCKSDETDEAAEPLL